MNLETGEALVSFLDEKGAPAIVQRAKILFPLSQIGAITEGQRLDIIKQSRIYGKYDTPVDRESAFEKLLKEAEENAIQKIDDKTEKQVAEAKTEKGGLLKGNGFLSKVVKAVFTAATATIATSVGTAVGNKVTGKKSKSTKSTAEKMVKNTTSAATRTITRELTRDISGNLLK